MQIQMHEFGLDELLLRVNSLADVGRARAVRRKALHAGIRVVERACKQSMVGERSGRTYVFRGRSHVASAPGEVPAVDTGNLKNSLRVFEVTDERASFGTSVDYGASLEFGTRHMAARPFLRPAVDNHMDEITAAMARVLDEALDGR